MEVATVTNDPELSLCHPSVIEEEIAASRNLDSIGQAAFAEKLRNTAYAFLMGSIIRDSKMLLRCRLHKPTDCDRAAYVNARNETIAAWKSMLPEKVDRDTVHSTRVIDITPTKLL